MIYSILDLQNFACHRVDHFFNSECLSLYLGHGDEQKCSAAVHSLDNLEHQSYIYILAQCQRFVLLVLGTGIREKGKVKGELGY